MTTRPLTKADRIREIRKWISSADARGLTRSELVLHLSDGDISGLARSPDVLTEEISFAGNVMRFLEIEVTPAAPGAGSSLQERPARS